MELLTFLEMNSRQSVIRRANKADNTSGINALSFVGRFRSCYAGFTGFIYNLPGGQVSMVGAYPMSYLLETYVFVATGRGFFAAFGVFC